MGYPTAGHLARAGYDVTVYNRNAKKAQDWVSEFGGRSAASPAEAVSGASVALLCSGNDDDVRAVVLGDRGALSGLASGSVLVDHTTGSAQLAQHLASDARQRGVEFLDAPVSGGQAGAENGALTIMIGGEEATYQRIAPLLSHYTKMTLWMGQAGSGQLSKMVNQICIAGVLQGLSEGLHFAQKSGLDAQRVVEVISQGAAQSWQMDNRATTMLERKFDFGFAVDWMCKDLGIALDEAGRNGAKLEMTAAVGQFYAELQSKGGGRLDTSSLIERLELD